MPLHPKGAKREAKMNKGTAEQYDRGNEVPSTWKQKSSLDNNRMASLWNVTHSAFSKIWGVLGAPRIGINSNKWTSCQISPLNHIPQLKNLMSTLPHLSPFTTILEPRPPPRGTDKGQGKHIHRYRSPILFADCGAHLQKQRQKAIQTRHLIWRFWTFLWRKYLPFTRRESKVDRLA